MNNITYRELLQTLKDYEGSPCDNILDQPIMVKIDRGGVSQETHYVNNADWDGRYMLVSEVDLAADYGLHATHVDQHMDHLAELVARDMEHYRCTDGHPLDVNPINLDRDFPIPVNTVLDRNRDERFVGHEMGHGLPSSWPLYLHDFDWMDNY